MQTVALFVFQRREIDQNMVDSLFGRRHPADWVGTAALGPLSRPVGVRMFIAL